MIHRALLAIETTLTQAIEELHAAKVEYHTLAKSDDEKKTHKVGKAYVVSTITSDSLIIFHKKFYFPNDPMAMSLKRSDQVCSPPLRYLIIYEAILLAIHRDASHLDSNGLILTPKICQRARPLKPDILKMLKVPDVEHLLYEVRYLSKYIEKEFLFKIRLSVKARRLTAIILKKLTKA
ncbi:hypothetical protein IEQ34_002009 [Dendrobium chrysotoxum]|uniref:Uncharacterized protein n=1 Tax=Dendrobium chrysotoxum TaxID=161865 RepID=A0AAV7HIS8_DENCH|nr:hypothetical protein IEQ34_002009 [Dendrobium chrysotoxum]